MNKRNLKLLAVPAIYTLAIFVFGTSMYLIQKAVNKNQFESNEDMEYVDKEIVTDNEYIPVVVTENTILKPYINESVTINKSFYDYNGEQKKQEESLIIYQDTYMQNSGVDYKLNEVFDIVSVLDGIEFSKASNSSFSFDDALPKNPSTSKILICKNGSVIPLTSYSGA